jgi:hypothetical protein
MYTYVYTYATYMVIDIIYDYFIKEKLKYLMPIVYISLILIFYFNFPTLIYHSTILTDSYWILFYLDESFFNEDIASAVGSLSALLLKKLLALLRNGDDPQPSGSDENNPNDNNEEDDYNPEPNRGGGPTGDGDDEDNSNNKRKANSSKKIPEVPITPDEHLSPDEFYQKQLEEAKRRSLMDDEYNYEYLKNPHYRHPESSQEGGKRELEEKENRHKIRRDYNDAVRAFNDNQEELVDREDLSPEQKAYLIDKSEKLREVVDEFAVLKRDLDTYSAEEDNCEEENSEEYYSEEENSEQDNSKYSGENSDSDTRPSKRPRND